MIGALVLAASFGWAAMSSDMEKEGLSEFDANLGAAAIMGGCLFVGWGADALIRWVFL